MIAEVLTTGV